MLALAARANVIHLFSECWPPLTERCRLWAFHAETLKRERKKEKNIYAEKGHFDAAIGNLCKLNREKCTRPWRVNKTLIKHLFGRWNKTTLFDVFQHLAALGLHLSGSSGVVASAAAACSAADRSLSRKLHVPPREQLVQLQLTRIPSVQAAAGVWAPVAPPLRSSSSCPDSSAFQGNPPPPQTQNQPYISAVSS